MSKKLSSTLGRATLVLMILTFAGRGFGFLREMILANLFGAGKNYEAYLIGAVFPVTINTIVYYIAQNYFIPAYNNFKFNNPNESSSFTTGIFWIFTAGGVLLSIILFAFSGYIISYYMGPGETDLYIEALNIFRILLITIPVNAAFSILANYLNAEYMYTHPAISQLILSAGSIIILLLLFNRLAIYVVPAAITTGYILQLLYVLSRSVKKLSLKIKFSVLGNKYIADSGSLILFIIIIESINQLYIVFDRYFYDEVAPGGIASLNYASTIFQLPIAIISAAVATVIFPKFAEIFNSRRFTELDRFYRKSLFYNILIYFPVVIIFIFAGDIVIRIVFERGKFNAMDTIQSFHVLRIYSVSLVFYACYSIINKMILSMGLVRQLFVISVIALIAKFLFNFILVKLYQQNGLAVSTSFAYILLSLSGYLLVKKKLINNMKTAEERP